MADPWRAGFHSLRKDGIPATWHRVRLFAGQRLLGARPDLVQHRYLLSERLARELKYTVAHGPFKGLELTPESWWSAADRGSMLLGMYEQEVLAALVALATGRTTLVDVGAADGYYAIGAVRSGLYDKAVCFEMSPDGRDVIRINAERNGVAARITVLGEAETDFLRSIPAESWEGPGSSVFLFDIEGGEFDLLTRPVLASLSEAALIVEVHEALGEAVNRAEILIERAQEFFDVEIVTTGARNPGAFPELQNWSDDDRWLVCSESRAYLMRWLILTPRG